MMYLQFGILHFFILIGCIVHDKINCFLVNKLTRFNKKMIVEVTNIILILRIRVFVARSIIHVFDTGSVSIWTIELEPNSILSSYIGIYACI